MKDGMAEERREKLLGYLLDALEDEERAEIDEEVAASPALHAELTSLVGELQPLSALKGYYDDYEFGATRDVRRDCPTGELSARTCAAIWEAVDSTVVTVHECFDEETHTKAQRHEEEVIAETIEEAGEETPPEVVAEVAIADENVGVIVRHDGPAPRVSRPRGLARLRLPVQETPPHIIWAGRLASIAVGTLIAVLFFPVFSFVKDRVVARVYNSVMNGVETNMEYYKQLQETSAMVRAREASGSLRTSHSHWYTLTPNTQPLQTTAVPPPEQLHELPPLKIAHASDGVAALLTAESQDTDNHLSTTKDDSLRLLADPKSISGQKSRLYPFIGDSIFISGEQVYYRHIPTR